MKLLATTISLGLALGLAATVASAQTPETRDPAKIEAGTYVVDPAHTQIGFGVVHMGFSVYRGTFSGASGTLDLEPNDADASKLVVRVPVASVMTTSDKLTDELKGDKWFDADKFPQITFTSMEVTLQGKDRAKVSGSLTLHGVTRQVILDATLVGAGVNPMNKKFTVGFEADGAIKRSDFGMTTYVPLISDTVYLTIAGAFERQQ